MPYAFELADLQSLSEKELTETTRLLQAIYNMQKAHKNTKLMKIFKGLLEKIRIELGLRTKKIKSADRRDCVGDTSSDFEVLKKSADAWLASKGIKLKGIQKKPISIIAEAMKADLRNDPLALQRLGKLWVDADKDETNIKGSQVGGTEKVSIIEMAMNTDLKTDPMGLQKLGKAVEKQYGDEDE